MIFADRSVRRLACFAMLVGLACSAGSRAASLEDLIRLHPPGAAGEAAGVQVVGEPLRFADASDAACPALLRHSFTPIQGGPPQSLCRYHGKVLLIVNTASQCGYTPQYEKLEALYSKYRDRGLVVVGFPSNDFGGQEPGSNKEIAEFCRTIYGVQFPMYEKQSVARLDANPLYAELAARTRATPRWNFHKYVVDRDGANIASFASDIAPDDRALVRHIERQLSLPPPGSRG
jgi:glutathione peroxidase